MSLGEVKERFINLFKKDKDTHAEPNKDIFDFQKTLLHGFPNKPTCLAYDEKLDLLALGTSSGQIRIVGKVGVDFTAVHSNGCAIKQLFFIPEEGRIVSVTSDDALHLWEINMKKDLGTSIIEEVKHFNVDGRKVAKLTVCGLVIQPKTGDGQEEVKRLYMGCENGNIYILDLTTFEMVDGATVYQDKVMDIVPDDYKVNPGSVESIRTRPGHSNHLLIGYQRGLVILWDMQRMRAFGNYTINNDLEDCVWHKNGESFTSAHVDGTVITWSVVTAEPGLEKPEQSTPYGPFPCKPINKIIYASSEPGSFTIFSGGMPRASYGDRHCVTVIQEKHHVAFDLSSQIMDMITIGEEPHSLLILAEEELVCVDLSSNGWPSYVKPYLNSLHFSAITSANHYSNVPKELWDNLISCGNDSCSGFSVKEWPIKGGKTLSEAPDRHDLLVTGHENGAVCLWDVSWCGLRLLYKCSTSSLFVIDADQANVNSEHDEDWPPFSKVGDFDPYSDDPRLGIQKIHLCVQSGTLVVAGTAGQVVVYKMTRETTDKEIQAVTADIVGDKEGFTWKGHEALAVKSGQHTLQPGFQPGLLMQCSPPAAVTSLAVGDAWSIIAVGTSHGFAVMDTVNSKVVITHCTLDGNFGQVSGEGMRRKKSLSQSLRESFRRMRKKRDRDQEREAGKQAAIKKSEDEAKVEDKPREEDEVKKPDVATEEQKEEPPAEGDHEKKEEAEPEVAKADAPTDTPVEKAESSPSKSHTAVQEDKEDKPVHRLVEARKDKDEEVTGSMVRYLFFTETFIKDAHNHSATLWAGTHQGLIQVYLLSVPAADKRPEEGVTAVVAKELKLKHRAPIIAMTVVDKHGQIVNDANGAESSVDMTGKHSLVVCSEEQLKIFSLPSLKAHKKNRLTAHEGTRIRKIAFNKFQSKSDDSHTECCISSLNNVGDITVFAMLNFKQLMKCPCVNKDNLTGIMSCLFTAHGEGMYLVSPCEYERFTVSAKVCTESLCEVELAEGMRPVVVEPEVEKPVVEETVETKTEPVVEATKEEESDKKEEEVSTKTDEEKSENKHQDQIAKMKEDFLKSGEAVEIGEGDDVTMSKVVITQRRVATTHTTVTVGADGESVEHSSTDRMFSKEIAVEGDASALLDEIDFAIDTHLEDADYDAIVEDTCEMKDTRTTFQALPSELLSEGNCSSSTCGNKQGVVMLATSDTHSSSSSSESDADVVVQKEPEQVEIAIEKVDNKSKKSSSSSSSESDAEVVVQEDITEPEQVEIAIEKVDNKSKKSSSSSSSESDAEVVVQEDITEPEQVEIAIEKVDNKSEKSSSSSSSESDAEVVVQEDITEPEQVEIAIEKVDNKSEKSSSSSSSESDAEVVVQEDITEPEQVEIAIEKVDNKSEKSSSSSSSESDAEVVVQEDITEPEQVEIAIEKVDNKSEKSSSSSSSESDAEVVVQEDITEPEQVEIAIEKVDNKSEKSSSSSSSESDAEVVVQEDITEPEQVEIAIEKVDNKSEKSSSSSSSESDAEVVVQEDITEPEQVEIAIEKVDNKSEKSSSSSSSESDAESSSSESDAEVVVQEDITEPEQVEIAIEKVDNKSEKSSSSSSSESDAESSSSESDAEVVVQEDITEPEQVEIAIEKVDNKSEKSSSSSSSESDAESSSSESDAEVVVQENATEPEQVEIAIEKVDNKTEKSSSSSSSESDAEVVVKEGAVQSHKKPNKSSSSSSSESGDHGSRKSS